jgi:cytochrome c-type biogenesis protein CcmH/NrfG
MIEDWIVVTCGVVIIVIILAITVFKLKTTERRMVENTHKLRVYTDLLNAITELNPEGIPTRWTSQKRALR